MDHRSETGELDRPPYERASSWTRLKKALGPLAIVGGDALYRVHIHTDRPDEVLTTAARVGTVLDASTTSLEAQVADCLGRAARAVQAGYKQTTITESCESQGHEIRGERAAGIQGTKWIERVVKSAVR